MSSLAVPVGATDPNERLVAVRAAAAAVARFCSSQRVDMSLEKPAQAAIERALLAAGFEFEREYELSKRDIPDFLITQGGFRIVLELKIKSRRMEIYRQLERYAEHEKVDGIVLFSATAMGLPEFIKGKPAVFASMGKGWLR